MKKITKVFKTLYSVIFALMTIIVLVNCNFLFISYDIIYKAYIISTLIVLAIFKILADRQDNRDLTNEVNCKVLLSIAFFTMISMSKIISSPTSEFRIVLLQIFAFVIMINTTSKLEGFFSMKDNLLLDYSNCKNEEEVTNQKRLNTMMIEVIYNGIVSGYAEAYKIMKTIFICSCFCLFLTNNVISLQMLLVSSFISQFCIIIVFLQIKQLISNYDEYMQKENINLKMHVEMVEANKIYEIFHDKMWKAVLFSVIGLFVTMYLIENIAVINVIVKFVSFVYFACYIKICDLKKGIAE